MRLKKNCKFDAARIDIYLSKLEQPSITVISPMDLFYRIIFHREGGRRRRSTGCQEIVQNVYIRVSLYSTALQKPCNSCS